MREYINIVESTLLREYIFDQGEPPSSMLAMNVFADTIGSDADYGDLDPELQERYAKLATPLKQRIDKLPTMPMLPTMIDALDRFYYEGSDAYEEGFEEDLADIYDQQLKVCEKITDQLEQIAADPSKVKDMVIKTLLTMIRDQPGDKYMAENVLKLIDSMRESGMDFPEFVAIEKSLRSNVKHLNI